MNYLKFCSLLCAALLFLTVNVRADNELSVVADALPHETNRILSQVKDWGPDSLAEGLGAIWEHLAKNAGSILKGQLRGAASVLLATVLCGLVGGVQKGTGDTSRFLSMAGVLTVTLLTIGQLDTLMGAGTAVMEQMSTFSKALLPALAAASAVAGGAAGATVRQVATVFFADLLLELICGLLMPLVYLFVGTLAAGSSLGDRRLLAVAVAIKTICTKLLTGLLLAFTLYLTVSGIFAGTVDSVRVRLAKTAISGVVPVVGVIMAEASETVLVGAGLLKGTLGVFGLLGILALCVVPFLRIGIQYLLYKLTDFFAAAIGDSELCGLIGGLGSAFGLLLGMVGSCALVLLISILASVAAVTA